METLEDMMQHPQELDFEDLCSPLASQILDFGDDEAELFAETLRNSDVSSSSVNGGDGGCGGGGYDDHSTLSPFPSMDLAALSSLLDAEPSPKLNPDVASASFPAPHPPPMLPYQQDVPFDHVALSDAITGELSAYTTGPVGPLPPVYDGDQCLPGYAAGLETAPPPSLVDLGIGALYGMGLPVYGEAGQGYFPAGVMASHQRPAMVEYERVEGGGGGAAMYMPELMQRGYGSGDMQVGGDSQQQRVRGCGSPTTLVSDIANALDESGINKVGRLSAEERKEKIQRYMKKRNHRNFSKKIKYACRKTLADSRPRVRGRFAKNDELGEVTRSSSNGHEFDDDEEVAVKEVGEMLDSSDILAHISGLNSFKYNYCPESWT